MKVSKILAAAGVSFTGLADADVSDIEYDSRRATPGSLFVCLRGGHTDGHLFALEAEARGAAAIACEETLEVSIPQFVVDDTTKAAGHIAAAFFGYPSEKMRVVGITGTNGKTTTTYLVESIARAASSVSGVIGNIDARVGDVDVASNRSTNTPEAIDLQRILASMVEHSADVLAMEITSQGLSKQRINGTKFFCAAFSNLSRDHLDWHGSMENYFEAKAALFDEEFTTRAVINVTDEWGQKLANRVSISTVLTVGSSGDINASDVELKPTGSSFMLRAPEGSIQIRTHLVGPFNVENILLSAGIAHLCGFELGAIAEGVESLGQVRGRMQRVDVGQPFGVIVDYAHTPQALESVLEAVRRFTLGRVICVIGCGGDRDSTKRPMMGEMATKLSDLAIFTSDNPRSEDPIAIINAMGEGAVDEFVTEPDRREAIAYALAQAKPTDTVVIAGKGHETYQTFRDESIHFDDVEVAEELLRNNE